MKLIFFLIISISCLASAENHQFDISSLVIRNGKEKNLNSKGVCYIPNLSSKQIYIYDDIRKMHFDDTKEMRILLRVQEKKI